MKQEKTMNNTEKMTNMKEIILNLKAVRSERNLSYTDILNLMEARGDFISKTTLSRVFAEGSEETAFRYEETIRPIANALLNMENIEEDDTTAIQAIKSILKFKMEYIEELEHQLEDKDLELAKEKNKRHDMLDELREEHKRKVDFLMGQIELKDKRIDALLNAVYTKDAQHKELLDVILACPARKEGECK